MNVRAVKCTWNNGGMHCTQHKGDPGGKTLLPLFLFFFFLSLSLSPCKRLQRLAVKEQVRARVCVCTCVLFCQANEFEMWQITNKIIYLKLLFVFCHFTIKFNFNVTSLNFSFKVTVSLDCMYVCIPKHLWINNHIICHYPVWLDTVQFQRHWPGHIRHIEIQLGLSVDSFFFNRD